MTKKFICVFADFYLRADKTLHVEDLFARKKFIWVYGAKNLAVFAAR